MNNKTKNHHPFNELIENRWSSRFFVSRKVEKEKIDSIIEAASWAPSAFNEQPWRFIIGQKGNQTYDKILSTLVEWNQSWAKNADILILNITKKTSTQNGKPNATAEYDLGQSVAFMSLETVNQGLISHQMSGFNPEFAEHLFNLNDDFKAVSVIAIGYYGNPENLPKDIVQSEKIQRNRKDINNVATYNTFKNK